MTYKIRPIERKDDATVEKIIRACLIEYGADHDGTVWTDKNLGIFSKVYSESGRKYFVAQDENGNVVACAGIGELPGVEGVCELQRMFSLPCVRGSGVASLLMNECLAFAKKHYKKCYLETLGNMTRAQKFYEKHGFEKLSKPLVGTEHFACDVWYIKEL